jgi:hypothetical protein
MWYWVTRHVLKDCSAFKLKDQVLDCFNLENEATIFLQNVTDDSPNNTVSHSWVSKSTARPLWEPQISHSAYLLFLTPEFTYIFVCVSVCVNTNFHSMYEQAYSTTFCGFSQCVKSALQYMMHEKDRIHFSLHLHLLTCDNYKHSNVHNCIHMDTTWHIWPNMLNLSHTSCLYTLVR